MNPGGVVWWRDPRGFTVLEILLAFSILAVIAVVLAGSLRVGLRAWEAGERQATLQQEIRVIVELVTEALSAAHPYRGQLASNPQRVVLFQGEADKVSFVTAAPPLVLNVPAAPFHAVTLSLTADGELRVVERLVPAEEPFAEGPHVVLSRSVSAFRLQYLNDNGLWQDRWDGQTAAALPAALRIELTVRLQGRSETLPTFLVPIHLGKSAA